MDVFPWDQYFETGLIDIDNQHHRLVDITNEFGTLLSRNEVRPVDIERVYADLKSYAQYHFDEEEKLMTMLGVDERHISHQKREHRSFFQEIFFMQAGKDLHDQASGQQILEFLINWLVYHILGSDRSLAKQIRAIENGLEASTAYFAEEQEASQATGPLLKSLHNLFQQVSQRNKQLVELNQSLEAKVAQRTQDLTEANRRLEEMASTDVLTGLPNRRHAMQRLAQLWEESQVESIPLACMMIDADGFKRINDTYGHDAGDLVLRELATNLRDAVRSDDVVCRLGGDEFLIICPNTDEEGVLHIAELTQRNIAALTVPVADGGAWPGSISVGVAVSNNRMQTPDALLKAADLGVYAAKDAGKNCVRMIR